MSVGRGKFTFYALMSGTYMAGNFRQETGSWQKDVNYRGLHISACPIVKGSFQRSLTLRLDK
ncbi:unnamed protein product, partial [Nesidiocoris tenuis]